jgi:(p)ppGpp synthase/HD superfamily hydrolase
MSKYIKIASSLAKAAHSNQFRRDGITPYFKHCEDVAHKVYEQNFKIFAFEGDYEFLERLVSIAYLHDTLEDTNVAYIDIMYSLDFRIADSVNILTKKKDSNYNRYLEDIKYDKYARLVKIADMTVNLNDDPTPAQIEKYTKGLEFLRK